MRLLLPPLCAVLAAGLQASVLMAQSTPDPEVIVKDIALPVATQSWETGWRSATQVLDPFTHSSSAILVERSVSSAQGNSISPLYGLMARGSFVHRGNRPLQLSSQGILRRVALLSTPRGIELWALTVNSAPNLVAFDFATSQHLRDINIPDLPGRNETQAWDYSNCGDLDGDGWDDVFLAAQTLGSDNSLYMCLDGRTGTARWIHETGRLDADPLPIWQLGPGPPPDLDGDRVADFLVRDWFHLGGTTFRTAVRAISGDHGTMIWETSVDADGLVAVHGTRDLNGDGTDDFITFGGPTSGVLPLTRAWSGQNGSLLWSSDLQDLEAAVLPDQVVGSYARPFVNPSLDGNGQQIVLPFLTMPPGSTVRSVHFGFLDGSSGAYSSHSDAPATMKPFHPEPLPANWYPQLALAGDYDGDGMHEMMEAMPLLSEDTGASTGRPYALVIFGHRTLFGPDTIALGGTAQLQIRLPTLGGHAYQLLASARVARRTDPDVFVHGGLPTLLGTGTLLTRTLQHRALRGTLDAAGAADLTIPIPSHPALSGSTVHFRASIGDPARPGQALTQTTILTTTVQ